MFYCLRSAQINDSQEVLNIEHIMGTSMTFSQLKTQNVTSQMLLFWSASIDMAEKYQIYLDQQSPLSSENEMVFHNCTSPWFGPSCRLSIEHRLIGSFEGFVHLVFGKRDQGREDSQRSCYVHLGCETLLECLDWREICDGKEDCLNGADEHFCRELEMNECGNDEYRCSNSQCIPWKFYRDDPHNAECLDRTDELAHPTDECYRNPRFDCEEHSCRPGLEQFPCGDGQCISEDASCHNGRHSFLTKNFCTNATLCALERYYFVDHQWCQQFCWKGNCLQYECGTAHEFRSLPLLFGHVRYVVSNETARSGEVFQPDYICYDQTLCPHLPPPTLNLNNLTCYSFYQLAVEYADRSDPRGSHSRLKSIFEGCLTMDNGKSPCNSSSMYQCTYSTKCISKHRLMDGVRNCPLADDEFFRESCSLADIRQRFKCIDKNTDKCFTFLDMENGREECPYGEDEYRPDDVIAASKISFQTMCDGITHLLPVFIDGRNETDETDCQSWQCNNTYSRCDEFWSCKNGADEVHCPWNKCGPHEHSCVFLNDTSKVSCIPIDRAGDGVVDCLGGTDERKNNRIDSSKFYFDQSSYMFSCLNDTALIPMSYLCDKVSDCPLDDDETFCTSFSMSSQNMCSFEKQSPTDVYNYLSRLACPITRYRRVFFTLNNMPTYPSELRLDHIVTTPSRPMVESHSIEKDLNEKMSSILGLGCNRGVPITYRMSDNALKVFCLCPPSYYGEKCQYQNQRISLTLQIQATSDWRSIFVFLITLIDSEGKIESDEYIEYTPNRDCPMKYDVYLLYTNRPKTIFKNFSVRIDGFIGLTLNYRASWIFPLRFAYLPVHRLAVLLRVPFLTRMLSSEKCSPSCIHGQCFPYVNQEHSTFCHCESGWTGLRCDTKINCSCASGSRCIDQSICLCPPGRFGARCYLSYSVCHSQSCLNGGTCIPVDTLSISITAVTSACICPEGYHGRRCQNREEFTQIDISFHSQINIPSVLLVHFITVRDSAWLEPNRTILARKLQFDQTSLTVFIGNVFNIALAQIFNQYYLIILREEVIERGEISTKVIPEHRCRSVFELLRPALRNDHLLKRMKFYHLLCEEYRSLMCFYDEAHMCLCTIDRSANCWEFDQNMTYECEQAKFCGNEGQCFQDHFTCPTSSFCACQRCSFGSQCQFSTKGSTLSLDIILGYHIRLKNVITQQPSIVKTSIILTSVIFTFGLINSFLSFQTFRDKETQSVGCGLYLLTASIVSVITIFILALKVTFLLSTQLGSIDVRWFVQIQCVLMDYFLRSLLSINDWLSACVAFERAVSAIQGVKFNRRLSIRLARWIIFLVILLTSCSYIHDAVHRRLIDDQLEEHTWCLTEYSIAMQNFDWIINIFHFCVPFLINAISAAIVIFTLTRTRSNSQKNKSYKNHLAEQLRQHKHLFISPLILVALSTPRLIISFLSGCMGSARDSWFYLFAHYTAFVPSIMTLIVYILPSQLYKKNLYQFIKRS